MVLIVWYALPKYVLQMEVGSFQRLGIYALHSMTRRSQVRSTQMTLMSAQCSLRRRKLPLVCTLSVLSVWGCLMFTTQSALAVPLPAGVSDRILVTQTTAVITTT